MPVGFPQAPGPRVIEVRLIDSATDQAVDTAIGGDFRFPEDMEVIDFGTYCDTAGTTGVYTVDMHVGGVSILSTKATVDSTEKTSKTAAVPCVISDGEVAADEIVTFDLDGVQTTEAKGLVVWFEIEH